MRSSVGRTTVGSRAGFALLLAVLSLSAVGRRALAAPAVDLLAGPRKALVARFESLATWCDSNRLPGERDRMFRRILLVDPEHARSRGMLKYKKAEKSGRWVQKDYKAPSDWNRGLLPDVQKRRLEAVQAFRADARQAFDAAGIAAEDGRREEAIELSIDLAPDDADFRKERGDVESNGSWILAETVEGRQRRAELAKVLAALQPARVEPIESGITAGWAGAASSPHFKTYSTVSMSFCVGEVRLRELGLAFMESALGHVKWTAGGAIYVFEDGRSARTWLANNAETAPLVAQSQLTSGMPLPDGSYVTWIYPQARTVLGLRLLISSRLRAETKDKLPAWAMEGVGQRLCWLISGQHGSPFANVDGTNLPSREREESFEDVDLEATWLHYAAKELEHDPVAKMRAVLTMTLNAMTQKDIYVAYGLGAFLLETRPDSVAPMIKITEVQSDADVACKEVLGVDVATLAWRVRRWVQEAR